MGNCLIAVGLKKHKREVTILLVGLDNAGKTTAAKGILGESVKDAAPTIGFNPESLEYRGCKITMFDLGGGAKIRPVWSKYFAEVHGVIFVIDSTAADRLSECKAELTALLAHKKVSGKPVLVLANKQDVEGALDEIDLVESLQIEHIVNKYKCPTRVETCSAISLDGKKVDKPIADGFRWLLDTIVVHYNELQKRIEGDVEKERLKSLKELEEIKERVRIRRNERELQEQQQQQAVQLSTDNQEDIKYSNSETEEDIVEEEPSSIKRSTSELLELQELGMESSDIEKENSARSDVNIHTTECDNEETGENMEVPIVSPDYNGANSFNERLQTDDEPSLEYIPIDSDDELYNMDQREYRIANHSPTSLSSYVKSQLQLESTNKITPKKMSFLKRYHKTAPSNSHEIQTQ